MNKRRHWNTLVFFFIFSVVEYLLFHIAYVFTETINGYALFPIRLSLSVYPVTCAIALVKDGLGYGKSLARAAILSLVRFPVSILYSYMFLILTTNLRTFEALLLSPLYSLGVMVVYFALAVLCYSLIRLVFKIKRIAYSTAQNYFPLSVSELNSPLTLGILLFPLIVFLFELVSEIITTVTFFISYGASFRIEEIIFLTFSYLFIILKLVISAYLPALLANKLMTENSNTEDT